MLALNNDKMKIFGQMIIAGLDWRVLIYINPSKLHYTDLNLCIKTGLLYALSQNKKSQGKGPTPSFCFQIFSNYQVYSSSLSAYVNKCTTPAPLSVSLPAVTCLNFVCSSYWQLLSYLFEIFWGNDFPGHLMCFSVFMPFPPPTLFSILGTIGVHIQKVYNKWWLNCLHLNIFKSYFLRKGLNW